ncbi:hypothetical protein HYC85_007042 [Camellia sinensis]|uniref:Uncharacterized protein n=1 Tax=Camellia sinensis TaxID=4442 RepID=A0A7J7HQA4_CAMSI|nr:hypothetical protein HYC85_007042 [Camellia sinensis]
MITNSELFELLAMSSMLMDYNWTEILKRKELFRETFAGFDPNTVAKMGEKEIMEIASNKAIMLIESRVRCIVDNAECIVQASNTITTLPSPQPLPMLPPPPPPLLPPPPTHNTTQQSLSLKLQHQHHHHQPLPLPPLPPLYPRNVPLRSPKAEAISRDLLKHGFRFVGPVIVYSFMQAAGMTIDHLVDCFRFSECVSIVERPWRHDVKDIASVTENRHTLLSIIVALSYSSTVSSPSLINPSSSSQMKASFVTTLASTPLIDCKASMGIISDSISSRRKTTSSSIAIADNVYNAGGFSKDPLERLVKCNSLRAERPGISNDIMQYGSFMHFHGGRLDRGKESEIGREIRREGETDAKWRTYLEGSLGDDPPSLAMIAMETKL